MNKITQYTLALFMIISAFTSAASAQDYWYDLEVPEDNYNIDGFYGETMGGYNGEFIDGPIYFITDPTMPVKPTKKPAPKPTKTPMPKPTKTPRPQPTKTPEPKYPGPEYYHPYYPQPYYYPQPVNPQPLYPLPYYYNPQPGETNPQPYYYYPQPGETNPQPYYYYPQPGETNPQPYYYYPQPGETNPQPYYYPQPVYPQPVNPYNTNVEYNTQWNSNGTFTLTWRVRNVTNEDWPRSNVDIKCVAGCYLLYEERNLWDIPYTVRRNEQLVFSTTIWPPRAGEKMTFSMVAGSKTLYTFDVYP